MPAMTEPVEQVRELFQKNGHSQYGGEAITQLEHALQAATLAEESNAPPALIAAALLHDVGHLLHQLPADAPDHGWDDRHEQLGAAWLQDYFSPAVVEPVRLHVAAKRYLCGTDPSYFQALSEPSRVSLELQGGPMNDQQVAHFTKHPHFEAAIALRRWDEAAKVPNLVTAELEHFLPYLTTCSLTADTV